ncbi:hypothetical protein RvY_11789 [Ramazzottius varieornatus]|uniref:Uncharacterized protein n=1 Tax=Ramazzottius varieornatus TaxID=947166 RepID=A0A1D1VJA1_RAMVA|nr:hypothetical protein RvY_11789 [Ramazzottius varieornatus]
MASLFPRVVAVSTVFAFALAIPQFLIPEDVSPTPAIKPKNLEKAFINALLESTMRNAALMLSPCNLYDQVNSEMEKALQSKGKSKSQMINGPNADRKVTRQMVLHQALPAIRDGISLVHTAFILKNTTSMTIFEDQNVGGVFNDTVLANYTQFYVHAGNEYLTQVLFIGMVKTDVYEIQSPDAKSILSWESLAAHGLTFHPRQFGELTRLLPGEFEAVMKKRSSMADMLKDQGTYFQDDEEYLSDILTVSFNGPENERDMAEMMSKSAKVFAQKMSGKTGDKDDYENTCAKIKEENDLVLALAGFIF